MVKGFLSNFNMTLDANNAIKLLILTSIVLNAILSLSTQIPFTRTDVFKLVFIGLIIISVFVDYQITFLLIILFITIILNNPRKKVTFNLVEDRIEYGKDASGDYVESSLERAQADLIDMPNATNSDESKEAFSEEDLAADTRSQARSQTRSQAKQPGQKDSNDPNMEISIGMRDVMGNDNDTRGFKDRHENIVLTAKNEDNTEEDKNLDEAIKYMLYVPHERLDMMQNNLAGYKNDMNKHVMDNDINDTYYEGISTQFFDKKKDAMIPLD